ncbi:hypothetical protein D9M69_590270 [compost metagenome]
MLFLLQAFRGFFGIGLGLAGSLGGGRCKLGLQLSQSSIAFSLGFLASFLVAVLVRIGDCLTLVLDNCKRSIDGQHRQQREHQDGSDSLDQVQPGHRPASQSWRSAARRRIRPPSCLPPARVQLGSCAQASATRPACR